ncbi:MAG: sulfotransferase [Thermomicrobiales bacterium]
MTASPAATGGSSSTLQIIGAGFGRTGTLSLFHALQRLGFAPCDHMHINFENPERFALWEDALSRQQAGAPIDWRPLLEGYRAIVDWPGARFWRELAAAHPDAKVILTVRDSERWYASMTQTIFPFLASLTGPDDPSLPTAVITEGTFGGRADDRAHCETVFRQHNAAVQAAIAPERLLVFEMREGWAPLCAFLGEPIPDEPFPNTNDVAAFRSEAALPS